MATPIRLPLQETPAADALRTTLAVIGKHLLYANDAEVVRIALAATVANLDPDCSPVWLMIVGPPSCGKSELVEMIGGADPRIYLRDSMTQAALLGKGKTDPHLVGPPPISGLLKQIGDHGIIAIPEFSAILASISGGPSTLLPMLRKIYDGSAKRDIHTEDGAVSLHWKGKCGFIGGSAQGIDDVRTVISEMGDRFIYYRIDKTQDRRSALLSLKSASAGVSDQSKRDEMIPAVRNVLAAGSAAFASTANSVGDVGLNYLLTLAEWTAQSCGVVVRNRKSQNQDVENRHDAQDPHRLSKSYLALFRGLLAIGETRDNAWEILRKISWHGMPHMRAAIINLLAEKTSCTESYYSGDKRIAEDINHDTKPVRRALDDLRLHGVVEQAQNTRQGAVNSWRLTEWARKQYVAVSLPPSAEVVEIKRSRFSVHWCPPDDYKPVYDPPLDQRGTDSDDEPPY